MNTGNLDLTAYQSVPIKKVGTFIYIIASQGDVIVKGKGINARLKNNQGIQTAEQFDNLEIQDVSGALNSVDYVIGNGEFLNAEISAEITGGQIQPVGGADNSNNPPLASLKTEMLTNHGYGNLDTVLHTIIAPVTNINGVKIFNANIIWSNSSKGQVMAKTVAPVSWNDSDAVSILSYEHGASGKFIDKYVFPIIIPAGHGLYAQSDTLSAGVCSIEYEIL